MFRNNFIKNMMMVVIISVFEFSKITAWIPWRQATRTSVMIIASTIIEASVWLNFRPNGEHFRQRGGTIFQQCCFSSAR